MLSGRTLFASVIVIAGWAAVPILIHSLVSQPALAAEQNGSDASVDVETPSTQVDQSTDNATAAVPSQAVAPVENSQTTEEPVVAQRDEIDWPLWIEALSVFGTFVFTAVLAVATIRLWNSTSGLYSETKRLASLAATQSEDMKSSIAAARKAADAATVSADRLLRIDRPYFVLTGTRIEGSPNIESLEKWGASNGQLSTDHPIRLFADVRNVGTRTGFLWTISITFVEELSPTPPVYHSDYFEGFFVTVPEAIHRFSLPVLAFSRTGQQLIDIAYERAHCFIIGHIVYTDIHGTKRRTGFAYQYITGGGVYPSGTAIVIPRGPAAYWFDTEEERSKG